MRHGCTVAAAAALVAGLGLIPANVEAACDPHTQAGCAASPQPTNSPPVNSPPTNAQPADAQPRSAAPLQLKRFMAGSPARPARKAKRRPVSSARLPRVVRLPPPRPQQANGSDTAQPAAKAIATVPVQAPALALAPTDHTVGFTATTEPWRDDGAVAPAAESEQVDLPPGVTLAARFDEVNAIDLAADAATDPAQQRGTTAEMAGVALVTPASAAPSLRPAANPPSSADNEPKADTEPRPEDPSWLSWLYSKVVDGVLTVVLAIRSLFA